MKKSFSLVFKTVHKHQLNEQIQKRNEDGGEEGSSKAINIKGISHYCLGNHQRNCIDDK